MISRLLGFARDILIAAMLGAGPVADAFFVAFKFPNFFRRLFAEGAFNAAFVPLYARQLQGGGEAAAQAFAGRVTALLLAVLLPLTLAAELAMPWLMHVLAPGFADDPETFALAIALTRITFPYLLWMALVALLAGMLNTHGRFAAAAAAPVLLNLSLIGALLLLSGVLATPGHALAWGVAAAGIGQFLWVAAAAHRAGLLPRLSRPQLTPAVRRLLRLMLPGLLGAGVVQVNLVVDVILASLLPAGSVSYLYYADRVAQLPLGVIGAAIGVALLPVMSRQLRAGEAAAAADSQNRAMEIGLLLTLPAAVALMAMPLPVASVLFQRGAFSAADALATSGALAAFALGLPAYVLIKALVPGFFAREDTATPVKVAVAAMLTNVVLAVGLMQVLAHTGIALATAITAWLNAGLLGWLLHRRGLLALDARLRRRAPRLLAASLVMGAVVAGAALALTPVFAVPGLTAVAALAGLVLLGALVYGGGVWASGAAHPRELARLLRRRPPA